MARKKKTGPAARFGARYGTATRKRMAEIEIKQKGTYSCPRCETKNVRRVSVGVWRCHKCDYAFTGGAYIPFTKLGEIAKRTAKGFTPVEAVITVEPEEGEAEQS